MAELSITLNPTTGSTSALLPSNLAIEKHADITVLRVDARADKDFLKLSVKDPKITLRSTNNGMTFRRPSEQERPNNTIYEISPNGSEVIITSLGMHLLVRPGNPSDALTYRAFLESTIRTPIDLQIRVEADVVASARSHEWSIRNWEGEGLPLQDQKP